MNHFPSLNDLSAEFPENDVIKRYIETTKESWTKGKYYLGGQIALYPYDNITQEHLDYVNNKNAGVQNIANSWEMMSVYRSQDEFAQILEMISNHNRKKRMNGLLRAVVFWLSPARKRAAEKVFHPSNMKVQIENELMSD